MEKCPNCNGEDVQRVSVVYKTGVTTRFLKKKLAPPEPNANEGRYTVIICGIFLSLYFIRKGLVGETTNAYLSVGAWAVNVIIPIALWLIFYPKIKKDRALSQLFFLYASFSLKEPALVWA